MEQSLHHRIRDRAYEMWNAAGRMEGQAEPYWFAAEREVLGEMTAPTTTVASNTPRGHSRDRGNIGVQRKKTAKAS